MSIQRPIIFIHGAGASPQSFQYLTEHLDTEHIYFQWDVNKHSLDECVTKLLFLIARVGECHLIGHSLGGIIAYVASKTTAVKSVTTIATPFGGCYVPWWIRWLNWNSCFMRNIDPNNPIILEAQEQSWGTPTHIMVATSGTHPLILEPNDGVVTVQSQLSPLWFADELNYYNLNHFEVLLCPAALRHIEYFITQVENDLR
jgi:pimeloyl-ACP methyl ester carboxylesterase